MSMFQTMFIAILEYFVVNKGMAREMTTFASKYPVAFAMAYESIFFSSDYYFSKSIKNGHL